MLLPTPDGRWLDSASPEWRNGNWFDPSLPDPTAFWAEHLDGPPAWVILGGLGNTDEAVRARERWPGVTLLGADPDAQAIAWQLAHGWPAERAYLVQKALADRAGTASMHLDSIGHSSLHPENLALDGATIQVHTTTLDRLDVESVGPFTDAVLSLDCEGLDYLAILGGERLLQSGRVRLLDYEVWYRRPCEWRFVQTLLSAWGFRQVRTWCRQWWGHNEVWLKN